MRISDNKYVIVAYDLNVGEDEERELMEKTTVEEPLEFIFGTNSMLNAFEQNLFGLTEGESFDFTLTPEEAYGDYDENGVIDLPKNIFEIGGKIDEDMLVEGNTLPMMDTEGNRLMGSVVSVNDDSVTMDFNHPLAGETLHFSGTVIGVREATVEEIAALAQEHDHGHGCGCGDHEHGDCSSGGCGSGCSC